MRTHQQMRVLTLTALFFIVFGCNSSNTDQTAATDRNDDNATAVNDKDRMDDDDMDDMKDKNDGSDVSSWPERPRLAIKQMTAKYGAPTEVSSETMVWHNAGPYKRIMVTKKEVPHDFPLPHMDFLEHTISYDVPINKISDIVAFDASTTVNKTQGEMSARCDLEGHNVLTLNLARDIINGTKTVAEARKAFADNVVADFGGKHPAYVEKLQFSPPTANVMFVDKPNIPGAPMRNLPNTEGTDAEILSMVNAVNVNEILAAATAGKKNISGPVKEYAKMLHMEHGSNMAKTSQLGINQNITASDTKAVDDLKKKGAAQLAEFTAMDGKEFESGYLDAMVKGHQETLDMIDNKLMKTAKNDALKQHLTETRQHIAIHLEQAKKLKG